jgi:hypothetical protein
VVAAAVDRFVVVSSTTRCRTTFTIGRHHDAAAALCDQLVLLHVHTVKSRRNHGRREAATTMTVLAVRQRAELSKAMLKKHFIVCGRVEGRI